MFGGPQHGRLRADCQDMTDGDPPEVLGGRELVDALPDAVVVIDSRGTVVDGNRAAEQVLGLPLKEWKGQSSLDLIHPDDSHMAVLSLASVQTKEVGTAIELRVRTSDGWRLMEVIGAPTAGGLIVLCMRDLTQRRRWEVAGDDVAQFRALVQNATTLTMLLDRGGAVRSTSSAITRVLGRDPEDICGSSLLSIVDPADRAAVELALARAVVSAPGAEPVTVEARLTQLDTFSVPFELTIVSLLDDPTVQGLLVSGHDITRLRQAQEALAELAHFDALTGLPNRRAFDAALHREWAATTRGDTQSYLLVIDLDGFKRLNDGFGHAAGDVALRQVAEALRQSLRGTDFVGRIGGDEFGVILVNCGSDSAARRFEEMLRHRLAERLDSLPAPVDFTVGHAPLRGSLGPDAVLHDADMAMLRRKSHHS